MLLRTYEVCVTKAEMDRIIEVLPAAARLCPHLKSGKGFDNVFDEVEPGVYAIDTTEDGLCLFAYVFRNKYRCSLHTVALERGLPLGKVKPKACLLWPMTFSEGEELLSLTEDALSSDATPGERKRRSAYVLPLLKRSRLPIGRGAGRLWNRKLPKGFAVRCWFADNAGLILDDEKKINHQPRMNANFRE